MTDAEKLLYRILEYMFTGPNCKMRLRHGTTKEHQEKIFDKGTVVFTEDDRVFHIHDGVTPTGKEHYPLPPPV
jgi:uncharacterized protein YbaR (Trm112 family)